MDLGLRRQFFAEEVAAIANLRTPELIDALRSVPREKFLRPGPWLVRGESDFGGARATPDADARYVYHNYSIAIDEPVFVTIMKGEHVFAQLPEHIGQLSYSNPDQARFDKPSVMWRGMMGSDGTFDAVLVNRATGQEVRRLPQRAGIAWFAELPGPECPGQAPLTLAVPSGVQRR